MFEDLCSAHLECAGRLLTSGEQSKGSSNTTLEGATKSLGPAYEGGPGLVHGGVLSLLFDHAMGQALFVAGQSAMTVSLEARGVFVQLTAANVAQIFPANRVPGGPPPTP